MKQQLSSGLTLFYRTFQPALWATWGAVLIGATRGQFGLLWIVCPSIVAYTIWFGRRLSDVWLDGDMLQIKGPGRSFQVPLSEVRMIERPRPGWSRRLRTIVLGLDHPIGKVDTVRFIPEGGWVAFGPNPADALGRDLRARILAARAARA